MSFSLNFLSHFILLFQFFNFYAILQFLNNFDGKIVEDSQVTWCLFACFRKFNSQVWPNFYFCVNCLKNWWPLAQANSNKRIRRKQIQWMNSFVLYCLSAYTLIYTGSILFWLLFWLICSLLNQMHCGTTKVIRIFHTTTTW